MDSLGTYLFLYALVDASDGEDSLQPCLAGLQGVEVDEPPYLLRVGRLGLVVSRVPAATFSPVRLEANLQDVDWLEPRARAQAAVLAQVFARQAVLPMRFGTLFSSEAAVAEAFTDRQEELLAELAACAGQEEWTVRFCANPEAEVDRRAAEQVEAAARQAGRGAQYLLRRRLALRGQQEVLEALQARAVAEASCLQAHALGVAAASTEVNGLAGGQRSLLSCVYRIRQAARAAFLAELAASRQRLAGDGLTVLHSGPWPPRPQAAG